MGGMIGVDVRDQLQAACERGQEQLIATDYLSAAATLAGAEATAWDVQDFDTLARLYMPLQEARRQIRQRCGEGEVNLRIIATSGSDALDAERVVAGQPHGQLLVAGWGTTRPAAAVRRLAVERRLYVETYLAAAYPGEDGQVVVAIVPFEGPLPDPSPRSADALLSLLPAGSVVASPDELVVAPRGTPATYAVVMGLWERLHKPFLAMAEADPDPLRRMAAFRRTIAVDPACELAHQHLSDTARDLARQLARRGA